MRVGLLALVTVFAFGLQCDAAMARSGSRKKVESPKGYYDIKDEASTVDLNDPWEGFNQPIFKFNLGFDKYVAKPFISAYDVIPRQGRRSIANVLSNLYEPLNVLHGLLQLNPKITFTSLWRFLLNSTFGLGGLDDFAARHAHLPGMPQSMGKTLGRWGLPAGPYLVLPILGPSSVRDGSGRVADWFADPLNWHDQTWINVTRGVASGISTRDAQSQAVELLYYESLDPYAATRAAYRQRETFDETSGQ